MNASAVSNQLDRRLDLWIRETDTTRGEHHDRGQRVLRIPFATRFTQEVAEDPRSVRQRSAWLEAAHVTHVERVLKRGGTGHPVAKASKEGAWHLDVRASAVSLLCHVRTVSGVSR